jgi:hypothetical protein
MCRHALGTSGVSSDLRRLLDGRWPLKTATRACANPLSVSARSGTEYRRQSPCLRCSIPDKAIVSAERRALSADLQ